MSYVSEVFEALQPHIVKEPMLEYNKKRKQFLSSGHLKIAAQDSLADFNAKVLEQFVDKDTEAMLEGRANHVLTLEGDEEYLKRFHIGGPVHEKGKYMGDEFGVDTNAFKEASRACLANTGKEMITRSIHDRCARIRESVRGHKILDDVLKDGIAELTLRVELHGVECQVRIDWLSPRYGIVDMKTCDQLTRFERDARYKYGYFYSAAFYRSVVHALVPDLPALPYSFLAVEKTGIHKCGLFNTNDDLLDNHQQLNKLVIQDIAEARKTGIWKTGFEDVQTIELL